MDYYQELETILQSNAKGKGEFDFYDRCSDLYAAIKTLEKLEGQYAKGNLLANEYESECRKLISHCKTSHDAVRTSFPSIKSFIDGYSMTCSRAEVRLDKAIPATLEHSDVAANAENRNAPLDVNAVTESLITLLDLGAMNTVAVDTLTDAVDTAIKALNQAQYLVPLYEGREFLVGWKARFSKMRASDNLLEDDLRQLRMDVETVYRDFKSKLSWRPRR